MGLFASSLYSRIQVDSLDPGHPFGGFPKIFFLYRTFREMLGNQSPRHTDSAKVIVLNRDRKEIATSHETIHTLDLDLGPLC